MLAHGRALEALAAAAVPTTVVVRAPKGVGLSPALEAMFRAYRLPRPTGSASGELTGSGVIIDPSGLVITNHHVVGDPPGGRVELGLADGRRVAAVVRGADPALDLCLLQIDGPGPFPAARLGDSAAVAVGSPVMAVGHPFGFTHTVTVGVLSAKGRAELKPAGGVAFVQTDAPIHPGSSGGPLFDLHGEVIGINTAIYSAGPRPTGEGVGFAIPAEVVRGALETLRAGSLSAPPRLGLRVAPTADGAALVELVIPGSRADAAGLTLGDRIEALDGVARAGPAAIAAAAAAGGPRQLRVRRADGLQVLQVPSSAPGAPPAPADAVVWAGMTLTPVQATALATRSPSPASFAASPAALSAQRSTGGEPPPGAMWVLAVEAGGPAATMGVEAGDVVVGIDGAPPPRPSAWAAGVADRPVHTATFVRGDHRMHVVLMGGAPAAAPPANAGPPPG